jgi:hypothetical protein
MQFSSPFSRGMYPDRYPFHGLGKLWRKWRYGGSTQLARTGFLSIFLCPLLDGRPFRNAGRLLVIWLFRWLVFAS